MRSHGAHVWRWTRCADDVGLCSCSEASEQLGPGQRTCTRLGLRVLVRVRVSMRSAAHRSSAALCHRSTSDAMTAPAACRRSEYSCSTRGCAATAWYVSGIVADGSSCSLCPCLPWHVCELHLMHVCGISMAMPRLHALLGTDSSVREDAEFLRIDLGHAVRCALTLTCYACRCVNVDGKEGSYLR